MTPKEKRERLFRHSRPHFRAFEIFDGNDYHRDIKILWVAHKRSPFPGIDKNIDQNAFIHAVIEMASTFDLLAFEDENNNAKEVGVMRIGDNGWRYEPHVYIYPWATKKNILRSCVAFFQWARHSRKIGCIEVIADEKSKCLFDHVCEYGVLHYVGRMVNGNPNGDDFIYSVKGKKNVAKQQ